MLICCLLSPCVLPVTPAIGLPPVVGTEDAPEDKGDDAQPASACPALDTRLTKQVAGAGEQRPGDEQRRTYRYRRPLVRLDEADSSDRRGFERVKPTPWRRAHYVQGRAP